MLPYFSEIYGNAASKSHTYGQSANAAIEKAREALAETLQAKPQEIVFTSGATESINIAIKGVAEANTSAGRHYITYATEHPAVLDTFQWLDSHEFETTILPVEPNGLPDLDRLRSAIRPDTVMVCVMAANNEIGTVLPLPQIGALCRENGVYFMTDATQALAKFEIDVDGANIDLLACSAHKLHGPKGVGALYVRRSLPHVPVVPLIHGGGHENGLRSGTLNVPGIVGFQTALTLSLKGGDNEQAHIAGLRDNLQEKLLNAIPGSRVNGAVDARLAGNLNILLPNVKSDALVVALKSEIAISTGSACTTASVKPSHVLKALGLPDRDVYSSIRFGLSRYTTQEEVEFAAERIASEYRRLLEFANL